VSTPVLSIVGYSNSGKTTLMERLVAGLAGEGLRIATIKHSHHQPEMDASGKDSWRHKQAGAVASMLVGPERLMVVVDHDAHPTPQQLADRYFPDADLVLVEGYGSMPGAKIEVVRAARSRVCRCDPAELLAVATDLDAKTLFPGQSRPDQPLLDLNQPDAIVAFVRTWLQQAHAHG